MPATDTNILLTLRQEKGAPLTRQEVDANFSSIKEGIEAHSHSENHEHSNKSVLDQFGESAGQPTYNGAPIIGQPGADGVDGAAGLPGADGSDGVGIASFTVNASGNLIVTLTDETVIDAGYIVGPAGANGINGADGSDGLAGADGTPGADGVSVTGVSIDGSGHLIITLSDTTTIDAGPLPSGGEGGGVTDHGLLTGLGDDDHTQYLNEARHDLLDHTGLTGVPTQYTDEMAQDAASGLIATHSSSGDHDGRYYTETEVDTKLAGKEDFHGTETCGAMSFNNSTKVFTIAAVKYWYLGTAYESLTPITCDLDDFVTVTANAVYFVYFDGAAGVLKASASPWNMHLHVPVALILWNGSVGVIGYECHNHTRDIDWHNNAHATIGTRYQSGLVQTLPSTVTDNQIAIGGGTIWDEDIQVNIEPQTQARLWYKNTSGVYTFNDSPTSLPYSWNAGTSKVQYVNTGNHVLTDLANNQYTVVWVYATTDTAVPIYLLVGEHATPYSSAANARAATPPSLGASPFNPESKLIYRWIFQGDGNFIEGADYRQASTLPAGGSAATSASSVSFTPSGNISAVTVQAAIEELDAEKAVADHAHASLYQPLDTQLTDLAALSYSGNAGKVVAVTSGADGFELVTASSGGGGTWGSITGDLEDQTDLQTALDAKMTQVDTPKIVTAASAPSTPASGDIWVDTATAFNAGQSLLVAETVVSGSAVTSVTFSGLDGNAHGGYVLDFSILNSSGSSSIMSIVVNNITTATQYYQQYHFSNSTSVTASRTNSNTFLSVSSSNNFTGFGYINRTASANVVCNINWSGTPGSAFGGGATYVTLSGTTVENITTLTVTGSVANSIAVGSTFRLYRRK